MSASQRIAQNLARVQQRIAVAAARCGRDANEIRLVGVTKGVSAEQVAAVVAAGCTDLGESRPQELWAKAEALAALPIRWHQIGHLQRNKLRRTLPYLSLIHSVDSGRLLAAIDEEAGLINRVADVLLEVNISGEPNKTGLAIAEVRPLLARAGDYRNVAIRGLMGMAGLEGHIEEARADFRRLRELRDELVASTPTGPSLVELSMGMSDDFEIAIEEGATILRVGSALFEGLD